MDATYFEDFEIGHVEESAEIAVDRAEMIEYAKRNDPWPIHTDPEMAAGTPFGDVIASFGYVVSLFFRAVHTMASNETSQDAFLGALEWRVQFKSGVRGDDRLHVRNTITEMRRTSKGDRGVMTEQCEVLNQDGEPRVIIDVVSLVRARPAES